MTAPTTIFDSPDQEPPAPLQTSRRQNQVAIQVIESVQTLLTALMLAFILRSFFIEAFIIPTGSMAQSLLGQHATIVCPNCGWEFDFGPDNGYHSPNTTLEGFCVPPYAFCPNCHNHIIIDPKKIAVRNGDRILVHKWPYVFNHLLGPDRWDVIVFRDPADPQQNFIKRLVALPNEAIEIIDGDVHIRKPDQNEFHIARKTPAAQSMLWFVVFDQNFLPTDAALANRSPAWVSDGNDRSDTWNGLATRLIECQPPDHSEHSIAFAPLGSRFYLQDVYAYNHGSGDSYVGDIRLRAELTPTAGNGFTRWDIVRDQRTFSLSITRDGQVELSTHAHEQIPQILATASVPALFNHRPRMIEFAHLDYRVYVSIDGQPLLATTDAQYAPDLEQLRATIRIRPLELRITTQDLAFRLRDLRVDRDVHYAYNRNNTQRAYAGHPFQLGPDQYFVLGDNSPNSHDSREWYAVGPHLIEDFRADRYQVGTVPARQIVGRAFFVYLPSLLPIDQRGNWRIPDLGRMRFIR